jgi:hypothetical protein
MTERVKKEMIPSRTVARCRVEAKVGLLGANRLRYPKPGFAERRGQIWGAKFSAFSTGTITTLVRSFVWYIWVECCSG